jgi:hypothetical protein
MAHDGDSLRLDGFASIDRLDPMEQAQDVALADALERVAHACGMEFDRTLARVAVDQARRDHPGPLELVWKERFGQVASGFGLRVTRHWLPVTRAAALSKRDAPIVGLKKAPAADENPLLVIIGGDRGSAKVADHLQSPGGDHAGRSTRL